jgi:hypothetical protein
MSEFRTYRALTRIHLPPPEEGHLEKNEVISFDGKIIKREDGSEVKLPFPSALNGAINAKWLVPVESEQTQYIPQPAGVEVHAAQSTSEKRERVDVMTVADEERNIGSRVAVRRDADQNSAQKVSQAVPTGAAETEDGVVVGRLKTKAKGETVEIGKGDQALKNKLDNAAPAGVEKVARATGDVQEARVGDHLQELLPDAASSETPEPGIFDDDGVQVSSGGGSTVGGSDDGVVVGKIGEPREGFIDLTKNAPALESALRIWAQTGRTWNGEALRLNELQVMVRSALLSLDSARDEVAEMKEAASVLDAIVQAATPVEESEEDAPAPVSKTLSWDLKTHWRTRQRVALNDHGNDPEALQAILGAESSTAVKKAVQARLNELRA